MDRTCNSDALFVDLYQLTMAQAYLDSGQTHDAVFSLFFRTFPANRAYYVFCGLESVVGYLEGLRFSSEDIQALERLGLFSDALLDYLESFRFSGSVRAMAEGELFFPSEPVIEVTAPIIEGQLVETFLINQVNLESMLTTKCARIVEAARGRPVVDFSARRTHGLDAATKMSRASYIGGFAGTSNVEAGARFGIPVFGTMAHSFVTTFDTEIDAFRSYARSFPETSTFLVDTYDTETGVRNSIEVAREMAAAGHRLRAVRLDSGDIAGLSRSARTMLDEAGLDYVDVFASGGLDEYSVDELTSSGAPVDGFGVGTRVGTSADAPYTDFVYKLVEYDRMPVMKFSQDKSTLPGPKQVYRRFGEGGRLDRDAIDTLESDPPGDEYEPLLAPVMSGGQRVIEPVPLAQSREFHAERIATLPAYLRGVSPQGRYRVEVSDELNRLTTDVEQAAHARGALRMEHDAKT